MSDTKDEGTGELEDEQLSDVSGGGGGVPGTDFMEQEGIVSPRDPASGLPTGKRQHKPMTITNELDKSTPIIISS